jgi:hypothetical protein
MQVETPALDDAMGAQVVKNLVGLVRIALARGPVSGDEVGEPRSTSAAAAADSNNDSEEEEQEEEQEAAGAHGERQGDALGASGGRAWIPREVEWVFKRMGRAAANGTDAQVSVKLHGAELDGSA